jgi:hypothetical protein
MRTRITGLLAVVLLSLVTPATPIRAEPPAAPPSVRPERGPLALRFEPNVGQADPSVHYVARGDGYAITVAPGSIALATRPGPGPADVLVVRAIGARADARVTAERRLPGTVNYLTGSDPSAWRRGVPTYAAVRSEGLYEGIDAVYYGVEGQLEYDFVVAPGADPHQIRLHIEGPERVEAAADGDLVLRMPNGEIRHRRAAVFQEGPRGRESIAARAVSGPDGEVRFDVGAYDPSRPLVIDPVFVYRISIASGGGGLGRAVAVDAAGSAYVVGNAGRITTTRGAYDENPSDTRNAFVAKLDPTGSSLVYATYLGGSQGDEGDEGFGIAVDATGAAYVTGWSDSSDFPTTPGAFDPSPNGLEDVFVTKLSPDGSRIIYSTLLGTDNRDYGYAIAVDGTGTAVVFGETQGFDFPTTPGAFDSSFDGNGTSPFFVTRLAPDGASLEFSTFFGGSSFDGVDSSGGDSAGTLALDSTGAVYITGNTSSVDFPTTPGAYDTTLEGAGAVACFVSKLAPDGSSLAYSTFLGGNFGDGDSGRGVAVDASGAAYVAGVTNSPDFPTTPGAFDREFGGEPSDVFVTKLTPDGSALAYSTYLGGTGQEDAFGIAVDVDGRAHVAGHTLSADFGAPPGEIGGLFVTALSADGTAHGEVTVLPARHFGAAITIDAEGSAYVTGNTGSFDFPATQDAFSTKPPSLGTAGFSPFVVKLGPSGSGLIYATFLSKSSYESGDAVAVGADGSAYILARIGSMLYPNFGDVADDRFGGGSELAVTKLGPDGGFLYSTFLGGDGDEWSGGIAVNAAGEAYVTGSTTSADFPTTESAYDRTLAGRDAFVAKLSADGSSLVFSTFLGGSGGDSGTAIALRPNGAIFVAGNTSSLDFPTTPGAYDSTPGNDGFVAKLSPDGSRLKRATLFGDNRFDFAHGIAVDRFGVAIVGTRLIPRTDDEVPVQDVFVARLNKKLTALVFSRDLASASTDSGAAVATDASGAVYVTGFTVGASVMQFPTTPGAFDTTANGDGDAFVVKLSPTDGTMIYGTFLGGSGSDGATAIAVDAAGRAHVVGWTYSPDFPVTADALDGEVGGPADAFVTVLAPDGASLAYGTFLGGSLFEVAYGVALGSDGAITVVGITQSPDFPQVGFGERVDGDVFVVKIR